MSPTVTVTEAPKAKAAAATEAALAKATDAAAEIDELVPRQVAYAARLGQIAKIYATTAAAKVASVRHLARPGLDK